MAPDDDNVDQRTPHQELPDVPEDGEQLTIKKAISPASYFDNTEPNSKDPAPEQDDTPPSGEETPPKNSANGELSSEDVVEE